MYFENPKGIYVESTPSLRFSKLYKTHGGPGGFCEIPNCERFFLMTNALSMVKPHFFVFPPYLSDFGKTVICAMFFKQC